MTDPWTITVESYNTDPRRHQCRHNSDVLIAAGIIVALGVTAGVVVGEVTPELRGECVQVPACTASVAAADSRTGHPVESGAACSTEVTP